VYLWTSEFVSDGHPDKVADQIADAVLDAYLAGDPRSKVACEVTITRNFILITGEVASRHAVDVPQVVRDTVANIGYTSDAAGFNAYTCEIVNKMHRQSDEIHRAVVRGEELAAGDQGVMFGYATDETHCYMPLSVYLAREIITELEMDRRQNPDSPLLPDAKSQVTLSLNDDGSLNHVHTVVVSTCHRSNCQVEAVRDHVKALIRGRMLPRLPEKNVAEAFDAAQYILNPSGAWTHGGPAVDTGLSGRKLVIDNFGSDCPAGGGSFSGKDASKVDRSGTYAARHIAKNLVAAGLGRKAVVQLAYAIGLAEPVSLRVVVNSQLREADYSEPIREWVSLAPGAILKRFNLDKPIFLPTASGGHFGRKPSGNLFGWEKLDLVEVFRSWLPQSAKQEPPRPFAKV
jgi:S-adenosylmethionine synthetase